MSDVSAEVLPTPSTPTGFESGALEKPLQVELQSSFDDTSSTRDSTPSRPRVQFSDKVQRFPESAPSSPKPVSPSTDKTITNGLPASEPSAKRVDVEVPKIEGAIAVQFVKPAEGPGSDMQVQISHLSHHEASSPREPEAERVAVVDAQKPAADGAAMSETPPHADATDDGKPFISTVILNVEMVRTLKEQEPDDDDWDTDFVRVAFATAVQGWEAAEQKQVSVHAESTDDRASALPEKEEIPQDSQTRDSVPSTDLGPSQEEAKKETEIGSENENAPTGDNLHKIDLSPLLETKQSTDPAVVNAAINGESPAIDEAVIQQVAENGTAAIEQPTDKQEQQQQSIDGLSAAIPIAPAADVDGTRQTGTEPEGVGISEPEAVSVPSDAEKTKEAVSSEMEKTEVGESVVEATAVVNVDIARTPQESDSVKKDGDVSSDVDATTTASIGETAPAIEQVPESTSVAATTDASLPTSEPAAPELEEATVTVNVGVSRENVDAAADSSVTSISAMETPASESRTEQVIPTEAAAVVAVATAESTVTGDSEKHVPLEATVTVEFGVSRENAEAGTDSAVNAVATDQSSVPPLQPTELAAAETGAIVEESQNEVTACVNVDVTRSNVEHTATNAASLATASDVSPEEVESVYAPTISAITVAKTGDEGSAEGPTTAINVQIQQPDGASTVVSDSGIVPTPVAAENVDQFEAVAPSVKIEQLANEIVEAALQDAGSKVSSNTEEGQLPEVGISVEVFPGSGSVPEPSTESSSNVADEIADSNAQEVAVSVFGAEESVSQANEPAAPDTVVDIPITIEFSGKTDSEPQAPPPPTPEPTSNAGEEVVLVTIQPTGEPARQEMPTQDAAPSSGDIQAITEPPQEPALDSAPVSTTENAIPASVETAPPTVEAGQALESAAEKADLADVERVEPTVKDAEQKDEEKTSEQPVTVMPTEASVTEQPSETSAETKTVPTEPSAPTSAETGALKENEEIQGIKEVSFETPVESVATENEKAVEIPVEVTTPNAEVPITEPQTDIPKKQEEPTPTSATEAAAEGKPNAEIVDHAEIKPDSPKTTSVDTDLPAVGVTEEQPPSAPQSAVAESADGVLIQNDFAKPMMDITDANAETPTEHVETNPDEIVFQCSFAKPLDPSKPGEQSEPFPSVKEEPVVSEAVSQPAKPWKPDDDVNLQSGFAKPMMETTKPTSETQSTESPTDQITYQESFQKPMLEESVTAKSDTTAQQTPQETESVSTPKTVEAPVEIKPAASSSPKIDDAVESSLFSESPRPTDDDWVDVPSTGVVRDIPITVQVKSDSAVSKPEEPTKIDLTPLLDQTPKPSSDESNATKADESSGIVFYDVPATDAAAPKPEPAAASGTTDPASGIVFYDVPATNDAPKSPIKDDMEFNISEYEEKLRKNTQEALNLVDKLCEAAQTPAPREPRETREPEPSSPKVEPVPVRKVSDEREPSRTTEPRSVPSERPQHSSRSPETRSRSRSSSQTRQFSEEGLETRSYRVNPDLMEEPTGAVLLPNHHLALADYKKGLSLFNLQTKDLKVVDGGSKWRRPQCLIYLPRAKELLVLCEYSEKEDGNFELFILRFTPTLEYVNRVEAPKYIKEREIGIFRMCYCHRTGCVYLAASTFNTGYLYELSPEGIWTEVYIGRNRVFTDVQIFAVIGPVTEIMLVESTKDYIVVVSVYNSEKADLRSIAACEKPSALFIDERGLVIIHDRSNCKIGVHDRLDYLKFYDIALVEHSRVLLSAWDGLLAVLQPNKKDLRLYKY